MRFPDRYTTAQKTAAQIQTKYVRQNAFLPASGGCPNAYRQACRRASFRCEHPGSDSAHLLPGGGRCLRCGAGFLLACGHHGMGADCRRGIKQAAGRGVGVCSAGGGPICRDHRAQWQGSPKALGSGHAGWRGCGRPGSGCASGSRGAGIACACRAT